MKTPALNADDMAALWAEILDLDDLRGDDHFFEVGGNSLLALDVLTRIEERTGIYLPLADFFADPTPVAVAARVANAGTAAPRCAGDEEVGVR